MYFYSIPLRRARWRQGFRNRSQRRLVGLPDLTNIDARADVYSTAGLVMLQ